MNAQTFIGLEFIIAKRVDDVFGLLSPYSNKAAVVDVNESIADAAVNDIPGYAEARVEVHDLTVSDSTGEYLALALITQELDFAYIISAANGRAFMQGNLLLVYAE